MSTGDPVVIDIDFALAASAESKLKSASEKLDDLTSSTESLGSATENSTGAFEQLGTAGQQAAEEVGREIGSWVDLLGQVTAAVEQSKSKFSELRAFAEANGEEGVEALRRYNAALADFQTALGRTAHALQQAFVPPAISAWLNRMQALATSILAVVAAAQALTEAFKALSAWSLWSSLATKSAVLHQIGAWILATVAGLKTLALAFVAAFAAPIAAGAAVLGVFAALTFARRRYEQEAEEWARRGEEIDRQRLELRKKLIAATDDLIARQATLKTTQVDVRQQQGALGLESPLATADDARAELDRLREDIAALQKQRAEALDRLANPVDELVSGTGAGELQGIIATLEQEQASIQRMIAARRQQFELEREILTGKLRELEVSERIARTAQDILDREQQRRDTLAETLGRLSDGERAAANAAAKEFAATGSKEAALELEALGIRSEAQSAAIRAGVDTSNFAFAERGRTGEEQAAIDAAVRETGASEATGFREFIEANKRRQEEVKAELTELEEAFKAETAEYFKLLQTLLGELQTYRERLDEQARENQANGIGT